MIHHYQLNDVWVITSMSEIDPSSTHTEFALHVSYLGLEQTQD
jgi:hypothetical protein